MPEQKHYVHETSCIDNDVVIGEGTKIWHFCHVQGGARIGRHCVLGQNVNIGNNVVIGDYVKIQNNVSVYEGVTLEDYVFCGPSMVFTNVPVREANIPKSARSITGRRSSKRERHWAPIRRSSADTSSAASPSSGRGRSSPRTSRITPSSSAIPAGSSGG